MKDKLSTILGILAAVFLALVIYFWVENNENSAKAGKASGEVAEATAAAATAKTSLASVQADITKLDNQVKTLTAERDAARKEAADAKIAGDANLKKLAEVEAALIAAKTARVNAERASAKSVAESQELERKLVELRNRVESQNARIAQLQDNSEYKKIAAELEASKAESEKLRTDLAAAKAQSSAYSADLDRANAEIAKLQAEIAAAKRSRNFSESAVFGSPNYLGF